MRRAIPFVLAVSIATSAFAADPAAAGVNQDQAARGTVLAATPAAPFLPVTEGAAEDSGTGRILMSAIYGGLAGAVIGTGVALIEGGNYGRDIGIGAGAGVLVGAALGAANAFGDTRTPYADGLRSPDRDPVITARTVGFGGRF